MPFFSKPSFHVLSFCTNSCSESAITTKSSAYSNSQGKSILDSQEIQRRHKNYRTKQDKILGDMIKNLQLLVLNIRYKNTLHKTSIMKSKTYDSAPVSLANDNFFAAMSASLQERP